ncbi:MAG: hypothetical protein NZ903_02135 [Candidatus Micrarchaeota archaeon]|nr:hypothetical protein [Candidatus Micrarchaeota archaeon]
MLKENIFSNGNNSSEKNLSLFGEKVLCESHPGNTKSNKDNDEFWFVTYIGFEEYEKKRNRLILNLRKWSLKNPETVTAYIHMPITISTEVFYNYGEFKERIKKIYKMIQEVNDLKDCKITGYISYTERDKKKELETEFSKFEFVVDNINSFVINATVPCEKRVLDSFERVGFQVKNVNKQIRRQLGWMYKKVTLLNELKHILIKTNEINELNRNLFEIVSLIYNKDKKYHDSKLSAKITRLSNEIRDFYLNNYKMAEFDSPSNVFLKKRYSLLFKLYMSKNDLLNKIEDIGVKIGSTYFAINTFAKSLDARNKILYNDENKNFELVLFSKSDANPYEIGSKEPVGMLVTDERISYEHWKSLSTCFIDIEKPLWRTEEERKIMQEISELQSELANKNSTRDQQEINERIQELTKLLFFGKDNEADVLDERFKEQISRVMMHIKKEDGSIKRVYFKIRSNIDEIKEINGFSVMYFDNEYELLNAVVRFLKEEKPYRIVGHVIPYDLSELRNSARENKAERFEIAIKKKEPRLWRRDFYQKVSMAAQEIIDTHRLASVWFPYLKLKPFNLSHKLSDVANFVYQLKKRMSFPTVMNEEFKKIITHKELRELEMSAIKGDKEAEAKIDFYATHDIDPLIEIFDFEPTLRLLYKAASMVGHIPLTDVAFTPTSMSEIFYLREWNVRHTQLHYGYKQKKREDERQIFKRRLKEYMVRQLNDEGIPQIKSGIYNDTYITYLPLEHFLSKTFYPSQPEWNQYFLTLSDDPIIKIAELQYPKYFMRQNIHVDYYLYRKEMDTFRELLRIFNLSIEEAKQLMKEYYTTVCKFDGTLARDKISRSQLNRKSLIRQYYSAYETVKDKFRSFYISFKVKDKTLSRRIKLYIRKEPTRREERQISFGFFDFFEMENSDIVALYNLPLEMVEKLEEKSKEKFETFKTQYERLIEIRNKISSIISSSNNLALTKRITPENLIFMFNQYQRAKHAKNLFIAVYNIPPEGEVSFRSLIDRAYKIVGEWIRRKNLLAIGAKGDYIFIKEKNGKDIDFSDSPLIPIKKFDVLDLTSTSEEDTDSAFIF